jgi:protein BCP1
LLQVHDLADLVLSQPQVGTSIKCDGKESDPYSYLTVLNIHVHQVLIEILVHGNIIPNSLQNRPFIKALIDYVLQKSSTNPALHSVLQELIGSQGLQSKNHVGFVFSERLMNMPVQLMPVSYKMLAEEIKWATDEVHTNPSIYRELY